MGIVAEAREALRYRELLRNLVIRELRVRYKNSVLGVVWSLANPIVRAFILWAVFSYFVPISKVHNYSAYVLAAFFPWTYFLTGVLDAGECVSKQMPLIKKVYFPRELLPLATTIANLLHFGLSLVVLFAYVTFLYAWDWHSGHPTLPPRALLLFPVLVFMETLLIGGIALFISAMNVFFEDVKFLAQVVLDLLFYGVPIIYFIEQVQHAPRVPAFVYTLFMLNPMTVILAGYRQCLLPPQRSVPLPGATGAFITVNTGVPLPFLLIALAVCVGVAIGGYAYFNKHKWEFVERL